MALNRKGGSWPGGYVSLDEGGRPTFVIARMVGGERFHLSTRTHSLRAAMKHLERFEADARAYKAGGAAGIQAEEPLHLTTQLVLEYRDWMLERPRPASRRHANEMAHRLADWAEDLSGVDLRKVTLLGHLKPALARRGTSKQHRIIALKGFCGWLRKEKGLLRAAEDATLDLAVPQASPEKHRRRKAVPVESVRAALAGLAPAHRDCLLLLAATGWHLSELERFARTEEARIATGVGQVLAVLQVRHKSGATTRTPVTRREVLDAARRVRERGTLPRKLNGAIRAACVAADVQPFTCGVMRHSVATWAVESGQSPAQVAEYLGHADKKTTLRFYADAAVPSVTLKLPRLT